VTVKGSLSLGPEGKVQSSFSEKDVERESYNINEMKIIGIVDVSSPSLRCHQIWCLVRAHFSWMVTFFCQKKNSCRKCFLKRMKLW
jgi:hypothetical protein